MGRFLVDDDGNVALGADGLPVVSPYGGYGKWGCASFQHSGWHYPESGRKAFHFQAAAADEDVRADTPTRFSTPRSVRCARKSVSCTFAS